MLRLAKTNGTGPVVDPYADVGNLEDFQIAPEMVQDHYPVKILDEEDRGLRRRKIPFVKVLWNRGVYRVYRAYRAE
ncbi:hypothetical protein FRX31_033337 [Thalictrum thalictroides]|uniref:Uncharacterized protein n=1 Tax=Thalictrum thalictroides TaxID=46969 RepID=A0A7J6UWV2_THATH|nr:hypothetical protein FRX31_033337 [Thalictrum thalictroides]